MPDLVLSLLGPVQTTLDGRPVQFRTKKSQAILLYLASEATARREFLLSLLWQDYLERSARKSLRTNLYHLKKAIPEVVGDAEGGRVPLILSDKQLIEINPAAAYQSDLVTFSKLLQRVDKHAHDDLPHCDSCLDNLRQAVDLYRGDFLADFYLPDSSQFENWTAVQREQYRRQALVAMDTLSTIHLTRGRYDLAEAYARRQLELDNLRESAHRQLMKALARTGRRRAALTHFENCRQLLHDELGIEPSAETQLLTNAIAAGELDEGGEKRKDGSRIEPSLAPSPTSTRVPLPEFLDVDSEVTEEERDLFVAREQELAQLEEHLTGALSGHGRVVFISGEAGQGKTALLRQFANRAQVAEASLIVASGNCNAYAGVGDPYLPFREVIAMLSGDVEARWAARTITRDHALRLWRLSPITAQLIVKEGADLVGSFITGSSTLERASMSESAGGEWLDLLKELIRTRKGKSTDLEQSFLFEQYTNVLISLAAQHPLLITLDDLQWADTASTSLLFHLGRRIKGSPILVVGTYRPDEVAQGLDGGRHPLEKLLAEFKRSFGDVWVELVQAEESEGQRFVNVLLDAEPNQLDEGFRRALFRKTVGHPLFTIELLRAMQARGDLVRNEQGIWVEGPVIDWQGLPARIEGVLEERFGRLDEDLRDILAVASVEGEVFTAEIVARVQGLEQRPFLRLLSQELDKRHHLVREREDEIIGRHSLSRYRFTHVLFQQYLYGVLSAGERRLLHGDIAKAMELLYEGETGEIANQLAHHYLRAGEREKGIGFSRQAAQRARDVYALDEAIQHLRTALDLLGPGEGSETRLGLLEELADVYGLSRKDVQAISFYQAALEQWSSLVNADQMVAVRLHRKILQRIGSMRWFAEFDEFEAMSETRVASRTFLEARIGLLEDDPAQLEAVRVLTTLSADAFMHSTPALDQAERYAQAAVSLAEDLDAPVELSAALVTLAGVSRAHRNIPETLSVLRRGLSQSRDPRFRDVRRRISLLQQLGNALRNVGEYTQAIPLLSEAESTAVQIGAVDQQVFALVAQAHCWFRLDRWDELFRIDERRRDLEQRYLPEEIGASCLEIAFASAALALQGDLGKARALREQAHGIMVRLAGGTADNWGRIQHY
jgi:DNA-binding SARP family transcriptional activator